MGEWIIASWNIEVLAEFIFERVGINKWEEKFIKFEEDPDSPEGAYGEWVHVHTTKYMTDEDVSEFVADLEAKGFRIIKSV